MRLSIGSAPRPMVGEGDHAALEEGLRGTSDSGSSCGSTPLSTAVPPSTENNTHFLSMLTMISTRRSTARCCNALDMKRSLS